MIDLLSHASALSLPTVAIVRGLYNHSGRCLMWNTCDMQVWLDLLWIALTGAGGGSVLDPILPSPSRAPG